MTSRTARRVVPALGVALALGHSLAHAAAGARLFYHAPEGCPTQEAFLAAVQARGASFGAGTPSAEARLLKVAIQRGEGGFSGTLELREGEQTSAPRAVRGASCAEVSDALAVVTAIALQADATADAAPDSSVAATPPLPASAAEPAPPPPPAMLSAEPTPPARQRPFHTVLYKDSVPVSAGKLVIDYVPGYTLTAGAELGVIPNLTLPRIDFTMSRANFVTTPGAENYLLGSILRVRWSFLGVSTRYSSGYATRLWGLKAGIGMCTPMLYDPQGLVVKLCSEIAAGVMVMDTKDATGARAQLKNAGIGTAALELSTQYNLSSRLHLELQAGGEMWLNKLTAERADGSQLFHSSMFNAYAMAGLGLHF